MGTFLKRFKRVPGLLGWFLALTLLLSRSSVDALSTSERLSQYVNGIEFNYISWMFNAFWTKLGQFALGTSGYMSAEARSGMVLEYLQLIGDIQKSESELRSIYSDPAVSDPQAASAEVRSKLDQLYDRRNHVAALAESIFQSQASVVVAETGLSAFGQPLPPLLFNVTPLPLALIISPRQEIYQLDDLSVNPNLPVDRQTQIEEQIYRNLDVSPLVVPVGGIGMYPTMIIATSDINTLAEVVCHEWIHNYLTIHPLGASYLNSPELRTMNETAASIAGNEMSRSLVEMFYPEYLPPPPADQEQTSSQPPDESASNTFNFNKEMHQTRLVVEEMLKMGKIDEAEKFMEERRAYIWENGYHIRKINQAFFAFYGAYADQPVGAAGADPVGAAVRKLREQSSTLAQFIKTISWMYNFSQLEAKTAP
jgi:hypothetical protein